MARFNRLPELQSDSEPNTPVRSRTGGPSEIRISPTQSPWALVHIAQDLQLKANDARAEAVELSRKLADITNEDDLPNKKSRSNDNDSNGEEKDPKKEVEDLAKKFVIMYGLWLHGGAKTFKITIDNKYNALAAHRFQNSTSKNQGQLAELLAILPEQYCETDTLHGPWLSKTFWKAMNAQRSNTSTRVRKQVGPAIFNCTAVDLATSARRTELFQERIGWQNGDNGQGHYDALKVDILHKNYQGHFDLDTIFLNPILMRVFVAIIHGPSAVTSFLSSGAHLPRGETMASVLGLTRTTPGAIAGSCVIARWALSPDECLQASGAQSRIKYQDDFDTYLRLLINELDKRKKPILNVFRVWDEALFPLTSDTGFGVGNCSANDDSMTEALDILNVADEETGDEAE